MDHRDRGRRSLARWLDRPPRHGSRGQALVEFALVFPVFLILFIGIIEFAFVFNAALGLNFATRNASLAAAEAGNTVGADCAILNDIQKSIGAPMDLAQVQSVAIFKADRDGKPLGGYDQNTGKPLGPQDVWNYSPAAQSCKAGLTTYSVHFIAEATPSQPTYPATGAGNSSAGRCDVLQGCKQASGSYAPLDSIGVSITYHYNYHTALGNFLALPGWGSGFDLTWGNVNRMEPTL